MPSPTVGADIAVLLAAAFCFYFAFAGNRFHMAGMARPMEPAKEIPKPLGRLWFIGVGAYLGFLGCRNLLLKFGMVGRVAHSSGESEPQAKKNPEGAPFIRGAFCE